MLQLWFTLFGNHSLRMLSSVDCFSLLNFLLRIDYRTHGHIELNYHLMRPIEMRFPNAQSFYLREINFVFYILSFLIFYYCALTIDMNTSYMFDNNVKL